MERNKRSFDFAEANPAEIAAAALDAVSDRFESEGSRLESAIAPDLPTVIADSDAIVGVILNLLDNAYKYSDDDKRVILRAYEREGSVYFEVEDHGIGLSRRACKKVFDRFYRVDQSLSRKAEGCGLGLNIVQFVVTSHEGSVAVSSQPGKGSKFTVRLPIAGSEASRKLQRVSG
jgi:signal transduction histidine kinase